MHTDKAVYIVQYQVFATAAASTTKGGDVVPLMLIDNAPQAAVQHVMSLRSNRANAQRHTQGLEEINQLQRAVVLLCGDMGLSGTFGQWW